MATVLVATDADWIFDEVEAALGDLDTTILRVREGRLVLDAAREHEPDLIALDLQIGNMGGLAACLNIRNEEGAGRLPVIPVLVLLDRGADVFLARRSGADGWLVKPLDSFRIRKAAQALLDGESWDEHPDLPTVEAS